MKNVINQLYQTIVIGLMAATAATITIFALYGIGEFLRR